MTLTGFLFNNSNLNIPDVTVQSDGISEISNTIKLCSFFDGSKITSNAVVKANAIGLGIGATPTTVNIAYWKKDQNTATLHRIENADGGTANLVGFQCHNGTIGANFYVLGAGFTTSGANVQNGLQINNTGIGGVSIAATHISGDLRFYSGGGAAANLRMTILDTGEVGIGVTPAAGVLLHIKQDQNAGTMSHLENDGTGTFTHSIYKITNGTHF